MIWNKTNLDTKNQTLLEIILYYLRMNGRKEMDVTRYEMLYSILMKANYHIHAPNIFDNVRFYVSDFGTVTSVNMNNQDIMKTTFTVENYRCLKYVFINMHRHKHVSEPYNMPITISAKETPSKTLVKIINHMFRLLEKKTYNINIDKYKTLSYITRRQTYNKFFHTSYYKPTYKEDNTLLLWAIWKNGRQDNTDTMQDKERVCSMLKYMGDFTNLSIPSASLGHVTINGVSTDGTISITDYVGTPQTLDFFKDLNVIQRRKLMNHLVRRFVRQHKWFFYHNVDIKNVYGILSLIDVLNGVTTTEEKKKMEKITFKTLKGATRSIINSFNSLREIMKHHNELQKEMMLLMKNLIETEK